MKRYEKMDGGSFGGKRPEMPEGEPPEIPEDGKSFAGRAETADGSGSQDFYMNDKVNSFSGITGV